MQAPHANPSEAIIVANNLVKTFYTGKSNAITPVNQVSVSLQKGSCTLLMGPSGSGKTTLLTLLACLSRPTSGTYHCLGQQVSRWSEKFLTRFRQQHLGIVFQHFNLINGFSAFQNIALPLYPMGVSARQMEAKVNEAAQQVNITHRLHQKIDTLSGGELQRVSIARALVAQPEIVIADEPTSHLDSANSMAIMDLFAQLKTQGKTLLISTHDPYVAQHGLVDEVLSMKDGKIEP